ncbi:cubilin [Bombus vosnesenskii]|uniref:Cubilin n=1 Tax=Bombus vosnesenskii TaxID=207650 RepID=A0A6J3K3S6_9HYME|nr:cubilin [Bombus vosnesenskii]
MATRSQWLLLTWLGFCAAWMDERPVLESRDGNLFISSAKDKNITLKILGDGHLNVNEINLLEVANAAVSATRLIERWRMGYLSEVESNLQRLIQVVEGPEGLEKRIAMMRGFGEGNSTLQPGAQSANRSTPGMNLRIHMMARVKRIEEKVKSIELKLKTNECSSNPCLNGGTCQDLYEGYQCHCPSNWEGPNCVVDVNECVRLLGTDLGCQNGATCHNLPGSYSCDCTAGWYGLHCTKKSSICKPENSNELCGHGVCVSKEGSPLGYTCICDQGWQSEGTNPACIKDVDECSENHRPCSVNPWVACRNAPGTFFCDSCPQGYSGNGYYCADIDECMIDNGGCSTAPRVQCINTMGSRMCGPCPRGYSGDGVTCVYVGSCAINNGGCHPLATCIENPALTSAYVICRCPAGMVGDGLGPNGCQSTEISAHSPCASNPCVHGKCTIHGTTYTCICNAGYTGSTCDVRDPCVPNPCKNSGVCVISNGVQTCDCPSTYTGNRCETPRQTCGGVSRNPLGHLEFPIGGNVYQHGLSCAWVLVTNSSLVLNVTFTRFNLEHSTDCKYDFLQIHDGRNAGSQMIGRFCGNTFPLKNGNIVSSHNSLYFWFHSDNSISHDGFAFEWNSIEPVCGGTLTNDYGTISSPGSPGRYPPNRDCYWTITVKSSKRIQIHFGQLMLEEHPSCEADFLEISTIHNERLGLYCNHTHPPPLVVPASKAVIYFHSDSAGQDAGFQIHYSAIEGVPGCNDVYTTPTGTVSSPTITNIRDIECEWKIQTAVGKRIEITWPKLELSDTECRMQKLEIYDGDTSESPLLQRYCGTMTPPTIKSSTNVLLIIFTSKMYSDGSFTLSYNTVCGKLFTDDSAIIESSMTADGIDTVDCVYEIKQPPNKRIVLNMLEMNISTQPRIPYRSLRPIRFHHWNHWRVSTLNWPERYNWQDTYNWPFEDDALLGENRLPSCVTSFLDVYDGPNENAPRLAHLCNAIVSSDGLNFYSTQNVMLLKYQSKAWVHSQIHFRANYTTITNRCGGLYTETSGTIQTTTEYGHYRNGETCIWTIQAPLGYVVQLTWLTFDLERQIRCQHDYVKAYENYMTNKEEIGTFCGDTKPPIIMTQSNELTLIFRSDSTITREGFTATYLFLDARKSCGGHFVKVTGVIQSPNYPKNYPNRRECTWVIEAPSKQKVILNVTHFHLENHPNCDFDYLEIRNGGYATSPLIGKFCKTDVPAEIISQTSQLYLKFVSDQTISFSGFRIEWDSTTIGCGGTMNGVTGDIISPNYPEPYMHRAECKWTIAVAAGSLIRLLIVDLQLEEHTKCRYDYIEIYEGNNRRNGQRYCQYPYPKIIMSKSNVLNIEFRSDFTNSGRGFHLKYETVCQNTLHGFYGVIESPNFPYTYEKNANCSWTIDAPIGNKINITFSHFDLEGMSYTNSCDYDYLEVYEGYDGGPHTQLGKFCDSNVLPPKIHSSDHQVHLKFVTDGFLNSNGFRLEWVVDGCGGHLTRPFDSFTSPGYPSAYPSNVDCEWLIEVDFSHSIELTLHDINTEKQMDCYFDKVQIFSGKDESAPKLVEICYSPKPVVYTSFGNQMFVKFHSDVTYATRGFNASYKSVPITCGGRFTTDTGIIFSKNYPKNYPHSQNCKWLIQVDQNYIVNMTFLDFDIEDSRNCTDDYVQIYDGPTTDSPLLGTHCGNELPPSYESTSNEMLVVMRTDRILGAKGFQARYRKDCGARIIVRDQGYVVPYATYTTDALSDGSCTWILVAEDLADHVTVTFTYLDLDVVDWTHLEVFDGEGLDGPSRGHWDAGTDTVPLPITSNGNALTVHVSSSYELLARFSFTYSVLDSACGGTYKTYKGGIASPNYPDSYPLNAECIWILDNSPGNRLRLNFIDFDLQQSDDCNMDYLEIREDSGIGKLINTFCGTNAEPVQTSKKLWIKFKSDNEGAGKGFRAHFQVIGGDELNGPVGTITSPLYPIPYKQSYTMWRITVEFGSIIRIDITDIYINNFDTGINSLKVYDGYDYNAPVLLEIHNFDQAQSVTSTGNVVNIEFSIDVSLVFRHGGWFSLNWLQIPRNIDDGNTENEAVKLSECSMEVALQNSSRYDITSPGWPHGYADNLRCVWIFTSPPGTHLVFRILYMDLEESNNCVADFVTVYNGNALTDESNANLLHKLCLSNSTSMAIEADNVMTVKFESDSYLNETGFSAYVYQACGGKLSGPNGVIEINNVTSRLQSHSWDISCEWVVTVRPGRTIEVNIVEMSIKNPSSTCSNNFLMLKNGGEIASPLLGAGKYCGFVTPTPLQTTGNRLYVKAHGIQSNINFKLTYSEVSMNCGGEFYLTSKQKEWEIATPNYPNIPPTYSECTWTAIAPGRERIFIHFIERFDLSSSLNCEKEYVEIRDGGTGNSRLLGRYCKDTAPSSMVSTENMMYVHFYTDVPEPKNGFKAVLSIKDLCGGIIRGLNGFISSPNYPLGYAKNHNCTWRIIAPADHTLKFTFLDINLPNRHTCKDYVQIQEVMPVNKTSVEIGKYCGFVKPEAVETASNEAVVTFISDDIEYVSYRGFNLNFTASQEICGGEITDMMGTIKPNGYPNIATRSKYCDWRIKLPVGYYVVAELQDLDIMPGIQSRLGYTVTFYNDFRFKSRIKTIRSNSTDRMIISSSNTMMIGYYSSPGYRGFKLRYRAEPNPPCGGVIQEIKGNLSPPKYRPFNESSYFCLWNIVAPNSLINSSHLGVTLSIKVVGLIGEIRGYALTKYCFRDRVISLSGIGMICGNFSEPVYLRSPKLMNELTIVNGTFGAPMRFTLEYEWQPCGGILSGLTHVIQAPKNISYPINCVWHANYPDNGEMIKLHFNRLHLGGCDKNYISIRNGGPLSPEIGKFCGNEQPNNITSISNQLWIEYTAVEDPSDFEFVLEPENDGCGGTLHGNSREISSPKFPAKYPNNAECIWEIIADNGYHVGLVFVDRFNLESSPNCEKDYVQMFDWVTDAKNKSSIGMWKDLGKVCGRNTPLTFNSTSNRMKVIFHSNEAIQGDGFRAVWQENCGGVFEATSHRKIITSPSYPNFYPPNFFCNYTIVAPEESIIISFKEFQIEHSRKDCNLDNVTISYEDTYVMEENVYCGENKPPLIKATSKAEIIFRTDRFIQRSGFLFEYHLNDCGGTITEPGDIKLLTRDGIYLGGTDCVWKIQAPSDKSIVLRFESFVLESSYSCLYDVVTIYEGLEENDQNRLAKLCGDLSEHLPVIKSNSSSMRVLFHADYSRHYSGFTAKVLFVKSVAAGCGGVVHLLTSHSQTFKTQKDSTYDSLEDCHWNVITSVGKIIKFTINSMDIKNKTINKNATIDNECTGDFLEVRDGAGPFSQLLGKFCGNQPPLPILSGSNTLWIRFVSDGTLEGAGVEGTFDTLDALCAYAAPIANNSRLILTSPNYPNNYEPNTRCHWTISSEDLYTERLRIQFLDFDLADSHQCEDDYVEIIDGRNRKYIEEGYGENFVWNGNMLTEIYDSGGFSPSTSYKYCGNNLPHDFYSYSTELHVTFKGSSTGHKGFKLEYGKSTCDRNFTAEQGRIVHEGITDCWITITAPKNRTISLYFNQFSLYDPDECTKSSLQVFDGDLTGKLVASLCSMDVPSPIFSTGNKLSLHSRSEWSSSFEFYDITYTTTDAGRGCGGRIFNYAGSFTSPMYPNEYRNNTVCVWDITVPNGLKAALTFPVLDIGTKKSCSYDYNVVKIYDITSTGEEVLSTTYCGGDDPAPFVASSNRVIVKFISSVNNIGTGWRANFDGRED